MGKTSIVALSVVLIATAAFAHQGVQNPAVMARMDGMSAIAQNMKTLGQMAKGAVSFNPETARAAMAEIARHAAETPELFKAQETDPKSEALPEIWTNFEDFVAKAIELEKIAEGFSTSISSADGLRAALGALGANCKSCHSRYRQ